MASSRATVTSKGQVTIPREVREHLGIHAGDSLLFAVADDGSVLVRKIASRLSTIWSGCSVALRAR